MLNDVTFGQYYPAQSFVHKMDPRTKILALIAFIVFNMTTVPCFAACATAKAELPKGKFRWTLLFWLSVSYIAGAMVYTVGAYVWPLAIWVAVIAAAVAGIIIYNKRKKNECC